MESNELFIVSKKNLPNILPNEEIIDLFKLKNQGDVNAKNKIIMHNIRLVLYRVLERFESCDCEKSELVSVGIIGLEKAVYTFNIEKNVKFSTYAVKCIDYEISNFLYKHKKYKKIIDSNYEYTYFKNETQHYENTLVDDTDLESLIINDEVYSRIREIVEELPEREKLIVTLYFGFNDNERLFQYDIAKIVNLTQPQICRLLPKSVNYIGQKLCYEGLIELNNSVKVKKQKK